jgi:hypothetical protein
LEKNCHFFGQFFGGNSCFSIVNLTNCANFLEKITRFTRSQNWAKKRVGGKKKASHLPFKKTIAIMFESNMWSTNDSIQLLYRTWTLALQFEFYDIIVLNFHELAISVCLVPFPFHDTNFAL